MDADDDSDLLGRDPFSQGRWKVRADRAALSSQLHVKIASLTGFSTGIGPVTPVLSHLLAEISLAAEESVSQMLESSTSTFREFWADLA